MTGADLLFATASSECQRTPVFKNDNRGSFGILLILPRIYTRASLSLHKQVILRSLHFYRINKNGKK